MRLIQTVKWVGGIDGFLEIIDQRKLPGVFKMLRCENIKQLYDAIKTLAVRGAPAIGVAGGYGAVLALQKNVYRGARRGRGEQFKKINSVNSASPKRDSAKSSAFSAVKVLKRDCEYLASSRPTAVNLRWAIERVIDRAEQFIVEHPAATIAKLRQAVLTQANAIFDEDVEMCLKIGRNGARFVKNDYVILTHCNAGALATAGQGTALSVLYEAKKQGKKFKVYADESRPLLQGSRLTAWELSRAGIDVTVICDNMAGVLMKQSKIDMVIVGADRIAANGDTANKIGTYSLSVLAKAHPPRRAAAGEISPLGSKAARPAAKADGIPFYIAAPSSTFDLKTKTGKDIPIEQRPADEVRFCGGFGKLTTGERQLTPLGVKIFNPAFDVTPAKNITAIITERGVIERPNKRKIVHLISPRRPQR